MTHPLKQLFDAIWATAPTGLAGAIALWTIPARRALHLPLANLPLFTAEESEIAELSAKQHVYYGLSLREDGVGPHKHGKKDQMVASPGIGLDIDIFNPKHPSAHKAKNLPTSFEEAFVLIKHLPEPSILVFTGNGYQVFWLLEKPLILESRWQRDQLTKLTKAFQEPLIADAAARGWQLDSVHNLTRIWRAPGFVNQKSGIMAELEYCDPSVRYRPQDLGLSLPKKQHGNKRDNGNFSPQSPEALDPELKEICDALKRVGKNHTWYGAVQAILKGESMAERGARDETLQAVCSLLAWHPLGRKADPEKLAEVLRPSLSVWAKEGDATKTLEEELEKAADKISRSQEDYWNKREAERPQLEALARAVGRTIDKDNPIPIQELEEIAHEHAIIQYGGVYFVYDFEKADYLTRPRQANELYITCRDAWKKAGMTYQIDRYTKEGVPVEKSPLQLTSSYGTSAHKLISDLTINESEYKAEKGIFKHAIAPRLINEPEFNEDIDRWLKLLAGDQYPKLLDWLAVFPLLKNQHPALYIEGYSGAGKGVLAHGLARFWTESGTPTNFLEAVGDFNAALAQCPLAWIDEDAGTSRDITGKLRSFIGSSSFTINPKFEPSRPVFGAPRLIIAANNQYVLSFGQSAMTMHDLSAVVGRIVHIKANDAAQRFMQTENRGRRLTDGWVRDGALARHVLELSQNREITPGKRFMVEGEETELHRRLLLQGEGSDLIIEWLARFVENPSAFHKIYKTAGMSVGAAEAKRGVFIEDSCVFVNAGCIGECWSTYMQNAKYPGNRVVTDVLARLASHRLKRGPRKKRIWHHVIEGQIILDWAKEMQFGNEYLLCEALDLPLNEEDND